MCDDEVAALVVDNGAYPPSNGLSPEPLAKGIASQWTKQRKDIAQIVIK